MALAWAPLSNDSAVCSGVVLRSSPITQHHVDAVAGRGERRGHPFEFGEPAEWIGGLFSRGVGRWVGHGAKAIG